MGCEQFREALSARIDGEDEPTSPATLDAHLQGCASCRQWRHQAASVTRLVRVQPVGHRTIATERLAVYRPRYPVLSKFLRVLLGAFGAVQFVLGLAQVSWTGGTHEHGTSSGHLLHESAAWNVAIGAGFAWIAARRSRPTDVLPMLTAFVVLLVLLSANDVIAGQVGSTRLLSHAVMLAGYVVVVMLSRLDPGQPPADRQGPPRRWRRPAVLDESPPAEPAGPPSLRLIHGSASIDRPRRTAA
ncbi:zf-HC2 domain-containing protein [Dactylosporangium sp. CA-092794]|uniref:zf-HC2 domain-containing protein n=1 Tax=Dactylosporangium sp. CA-092794 TaxID=3239929 RepID=UPI003D935B87